MTAKDVYDQDFVECTQCNAALLRAEPNSRAVAGGQATLEVQRGEIRRLLKQAPSRRPFSPGPALRP